jgi:anti-sigma B factor antagonist
MSLARTDETDRTDERYEGDPMPAFRVLGALDVTTAATIRAELTDLLAAPGTDDLVVDLDQMGALDTVGLGLLVGIHRQSQRSGRRLVLTGVPPRMSRVLAVTRLNRVLTIDGSPAAADEVVVVDVIDQIVVVDDDDIVASGAGITVPVAARAS